MPAPHGTSHALRGPAWCNRSTHIRLYQRGEATDSSAQVVSRQHELTATADLFHMVEGPSLGCNRLVFLGDAVLLAFVALSFDVARAEVDCETLPIGPARTDCYIGLGQINRLKSGIAAGIAQQRWPRAMYCY